MTLVFSLILLSIASKILKYCVRFLKYIVACINFSSKQIIVSQIMASNV